MNKIRDHYFSHDANASRDEKILKMREQFGVRGYGLFWEIIEYLFSSGGKAELNYKMVSLAIGEDVRTVKPFLIACIEVFQLFESDGQTFWSNRLLCDIDRIVETSLRNSRAARIRHDKDKNKDNHVLELSNLPITKTECTCTANAERPDCERIAIDKTDKKEEIDICGNKEAEKGKVAKTTKQPMRFCRPTIDEIREYCIERNNTIDAQHFMDHYEANGWVVGKTAMKDWKATVRNWERNAIRTPAITKASYDPYKGLRIRNEC